MTKAKKVESIEKLEHQKQLQMIWKYEQARLRRQN